MSGHDNGPALVLRRWPVETSNQLLALTTLDTPDEKTRGAPDGPKITERSMQPVAMEGFHHWMLRLKEVPGVW